MPVEPDSLLLNIGQVSLEISPIGPRGRTWHNCGRRIPQSEVLLEVEGGGAERKTLRDVMFAGRCCTCDQQAILINYPHINHAVLWYRSLNLHFYFASSWFCSQWIFNHSFGEWITLGGKGCHSYRDTFSASQPTHIKSRGEEYPPLTLAKCHALWQIAEDKTKTVSHKLSPCANSPLHTTPHRSQRK